MRKIFLISDLLDPVKGSEFRIGLKAIQILCGKENSFTKNVTLLIPKRNNNIENLKIWLEEQSITTLEIKEFEFKNAKNNGDHKNKFFFIKDLILFYKECRKEINTEQNNESIIFKCGQVNCFFNLIFLFFFKKKNNQKIVCAPISGFNFIKLRDCINLPLKSKLYYRFYNTSIYLIRIMYKIFYVHKKNYDFLFATYNDAKVFYKNNLKDKVYSEIEMYEDNEFSSLNKVNSPSDNLKNKKVSVLWSGHLIHRKNPLLALNIISKVLKELNFVDFYFIGEGPLSKEVMNIMEKENLINNEKFKYISKMPRIDFLQLIKKVNVIFITSLREVNSLFFLEALSANKKIIALKNSGLIDFNLKNVKLYDSCMYETPEKIADAFCLDLSKDFSINSNSKYFILDRYNYEKNNLMNILERS
jgi:glycosyltransferase involved in cell wall biosynthesis